MQAKEIKSGMVVNYQGAPVLIQTVSVQSPSARGAATLYKFKGRNLLAKQKVNITLKGGESLEDADFHRREVKLMYTDASEAHFIDNENYEQYAIALSDVEDEMRFVTEELEGLSVLFYNDECVGVSVPASVELTIVECDPGVKGNSATSRTKAAKLETGLEIQVPEYLKQGEKIKIDTRSCEYLSRV